MATQKLYPHAAMLSQEHVLVPAWKKAHGYIRHHNWYADVLECDLTNADLDERLRTIAAAVQSQQELLAEPLRLVLAPKSQNWDINKTRWEPISGSSDVAKRLRPLAHVSVRDQIIATAFMLLVADAVETRQGDPRVSAKQAQERRMVSYGHRLFCDKEGHELRFRWGNAVVYRQYFQDYQEFVARPQAIVTEVFGTSQQWAVVQADLSQFYDRIRPELLHSKMQRVLGDAADAAFVEKFKSFFSWSWHSADAKDAGDYARRAEPAIERFDSIALPQGLVASGFFSNVVLIDFDEAVSAQFDEWFDDGAWELVDFCRYVDDMRIVVRLGDALKDASEAEICARVVSHLLRLLGEHAPGLVLNPKKSAAVLGRNSTAGSIAVSATMKRINHNASGAMDLFIGEETVDLIESLFLSRQEDPLVLEDKYRDTLVGATPDVRDETVARFAANRFRRTYRTLRPLCEDGEELPSDQSLLPALSRASLDQKAAYFSRRLIERWVRDPSSVRLLRVALDLRPDPATLTLILDLLKQYIGSGKRIAAPRRVAWYCAAELLKAGATETGLVTDVDHLPADVDLKRYQEQLADFATEIVGRRDLYPWYLEQQAFLFLACVGRYQTMPVPTSASSCVKDYVRLHHTLAGRTDTLRREDIVPFSLLRKHFSTAADGAGTFLGCFRALGTPTQRMFLVRILQEDAELSRAIWNAMPGDEQEAWKGLFQAHGMIEDQQFPAKPDDFPREERSYPLLAIARSQANPFQQEYALLHSARALAVSLQGNADPIFPARIMVRAKDWRALWLDRFPIARDAVSVSLESQSEADSRFTVPPWAATETRPAWKYQVGQTLRVLLTGHTDFTMSAVRPRRERSSVLYVPFASSWLRRRYGLYNGRNAFGPPWLPISSWTGSLLNRLLEWPGFAQFDFDLEMPDGVELTSFLELLDERMSYLEEQYGRASFTPVLPVRAPKTFMRPNRPTDGRAGLYSMRVGVVQTVLPRMNAFGGDPELNVAATRHEHRRHLSAVLGAVHRMLQVRETHNVSGAGVEMLVFPELAVHPDDLNSHVVPFVLQHRCIVFAGMVFHRARPGGPLINSGQWLIPVRTPHGGVRVEVVEQGKWNLTPEEKSLGIEAFRPAQWILEIADPVTRRKLWAMSGAICYDSTDLCLAADLRDITDMFVIPALNTDVGTFDNMAAALHYHMFQHVIVSNCGEYGGSTGQAPFADRHKRTIFHSHGNEQVSVCFFEVALDMYHDATSQLKTPPAGYNRWPAPVPAIAVVPP
jgi:hypothetical protein